MSSSFVLVVADIANKNLGDKAIFLSLVNKLREEGFSDIYKLSDRNEVTPNYTLINYLNVFKLIFLVFRADRIVFGGGGIFQDDTSVANPIYFFCVYLIAQIMMKEVVVRSVGVTPLRYNLSSILFERILKGANTVTVRDKGSLLNLQNIASVEASIEPDLALSYACSKYTSLKSSLVPPYILVSARPLLGKAAEESDVFFRSFESQLLKLSDLFQARIVLVPFHDEQDYSLLIDMASRIGAEVRCVDGVEDYLNLSACAELIICMRLHAAILASKLSVPIYALSYNPKVEYFMDSIGQADRCLPLNQVDQLFLQISAKGLNKKNS